MKVQVVMPQMGESIAEGTIIKWKKNVGDPVEKDENILEISTDKVDSEIPSPAAGIFAEILVEEGKTVEVGTPIAVLETEAGAAVSAPPAETPAPAEQPAAPAAEPAPAAKATPPSNGGDAKPTAATAPAQTDRFYSPLVRSIAAQEGLTPEDLSRIPGTGKSNRVTKSDILAYLSNRGGAAIPPAPAAARSSAPVAPQPQMEQYAFGPDGTATEPLGHMRKMIAKHMVDSIHISAHVTSIGEVDMNNIVRFREGHKAEFERREGFKLTYTPFFVQAVVHALQEFPWVNGSIDGDNIVVRNFINVGVAVALEAGKGLIVPVIKNAQDLNLTGLARAVTDLGARARTKSLNPDEVQGGTFTITNPGIFGNIMGAPIINQPQVGILGVGAIRKRPVVINDAIAIRPIVYLTHAYDHRLVDGALGGMFLQRVCELLENFDPNTRI